MDIFETINRLYTDKDGKISDTAIHDAAGNGDFEIVKFLVQNGGKISDTAVGYAAAKGHFEIVKFLVENDGKISDTAVQDAAENGHLEIVKFLVENDGKISDTAVGYAAAKGHFEIVKFLVDNNAKISEDSIVDVILNFQYDILEVFISRHVNIPSSMINFARDQQDTKLIEIILSRNTEDVEHVNLDKQQIDFSPLTVVQNGFDTMVRAKKGSIITLPRQEANVVFDALIGHKSQHHNLLTLNLNKDHGNLRLECHECDNSKAYNKLLGLMPGGIYEESSANDKDTQLIIYLNDNQAISVVDFLKAAQEDCKNDRKNACLYDAEQHNCVDFLQDAYRAAGIKGDFADFITEEQLGFSASEILSADLYGHKAKGYVYARKHGMTKTIHVAVKAYEAVQGVTNIFDNAYSFISGALGFGADTEEQAV